MISCLINGESYDMLVPFTIAEKLGNNISSNIAVRVDDQPVPKAGDLIEVVEDGATLFLGTCGIPTSPQYTSINTPKIYNIVCGNGNSILSRRIVNYAAQDKTVTEIVDYLYENIIKFEGITKGTISNIPVTFDTYTAPDMNLQDVLNELAAYVSGAWQVTNDRVFNFIAKSDFEVFPETITADNFIGAAIQSQTKDQDMRTGQIVTGLEGDTDTQIESFTYDGTEKLFDLAFPVSHEPSKIVRDDGDTLYAPQIGVKGLDNNDPNVVFLFTYKSREIEYKNGTGWLNAGQGFTVYYTGLFSLRVRSYNAVKIGEISAKTGTSGLIESVHRDKTLRTLEDAQRLADSLIENYGKELTEVNFELTGKRIKAHGYTLADFALSKKVTIDMPEIGIAGEFVIAERSLESLSGGGKFEDNVRVNLKLLDRSYLKSYGQTLRDLSKENKLNLRNDVIIINQVETNDTLDLTEQMIVDFGHPVFWVTAATATENDPVTGLGIYPC